MDYEIRGWVHDNLPLLWTYLVLQAESVTPAWLVSA